jgi:PAS domain S-box-containing protein
MIHPEDRAALEERVSDARRAVFSDTEYRFMRPDGEVRYVHTRRFGRRDASGALTHLWGMTQDVTDRKEIELELRRARDHSEAILAAMSEGYALTVGGTITAVNDALCRLTGFPREELLGSSAPFPFWPPDGLTEAIAVRDRIVGAGGGTFELTVVRKDGTRFEAEITAHPALNPDGTRLGFVNTLRDISDRKRHEAELQRLARHDSLTGLANHGVLHEQLEAEVARARRGGHALSLAIIDVDHFKAINDRHGHLAGDDVLRVIAERLAGLTLPARTRPPNGLGAWWRRRRSRRPGPCACRSGCASSDPKTAPESSTSTPTRPCTRPSETGATARRATTPTCLVDPAELDDRHAEHGQPEAEDHRGVDDDRHVEVPPGHARIERLARDL